MSNVAAPGRIIHIPFLSANGMVIRPGIIVDVNPNGTTVSARVFLDGFLDHPSWTPSMECLNGLREIPTPATPVDPTTLSTGTWYWPPRV